MENSYTANTGEKVKANISKIHFLSFSWLSNNWLDKNDVLSWKDPWEDTSIATYSEIGFRLKCKM